MRKLGYISQRGVARSMEIATYRRRKCPEEQNLFWKNKECLVSVLCEDWIALSYHIRGTMNIH